jgi:prevent-host-death family protein
MAVKIADLKNNLSRHLARVRRGSEITAYDRNTPVARILPYRAGHGGRTAGQAGLRADVPFAEIERSVGPRRRRTVDLDQEQLLRSRVAARLPHFVLPEQRIGRNRMVRNAAIAAGNSGLPALIPVLEKLTADVDAVVAEAARWALGQLSAG